MLGNKESAEIHLQKVAKASPEVYSSFIKSEDIQILPLNTGNQFSNYFPICELSEYPNVKIRPAFRLPRLQPPLEILDTYDLLLYLIENEGISARPEVPWLSKVKDNYKFTENLLEDIEECKSEKKIHSNAVAYASQAICRDKFSFVLNNQSSKVHLQALINKLQQV